MHDELLVLFASKPYSEKGGEDLGHLTNGLLNQRLNPEYDELKHVWDGATFRRILLDTYNVDYDEVVKPQVREIISALMASGLDKVRIETVSSFPDGEAASKSLPKTFGYLRVDFLLDSSFKAWLLECEIVPSTGTIGGNDEILKRRVMHDTFGLLEVEREEQQGEVEYVEALINAGERVNKDEINYSESGKSGPGLGGFECIFPCVDKRSEIEVRVFKALRNEIELDSDKVVRDHWGSDLRSGWEGEVEGGSWDGGEDGVTEFGEEMLEKQCKRCADVGKQQGAGLCVAPVSIENSGRVSFLGKCALPGEPCLHSLHDFIDAMRVTECSEIAETLWVGDTVAKSGLAYMAEFEEGERGLAGAKQRQHLRKPITNKPLHAPRRLRRFMRKCVFDSFEGDGDKGGL